MGAEAEPTQSGHVMLPECLALPAVGTVIDGRYRIIKPIGAGGMGAVYEAEQVRVGRRCAVKFLRTELLGRTRSAGRFHREARILGGLEHEHLTAVLDHGMYMDRSPFLVMEYVEGCTLKQLLVKRGALPVPEALHILCQVAEGMAYVHARGIIHRDLKPGNLMVTSRSNGQPWAKILDFGIARVLDDVERHVTPTGADLGTAAYMSPEQARGAKEVAASADVFALGTVLYEAVTGVRPHPGESYNAVMFHLLTQQHRPLRYVLPGCHPALDALVERCLEEHAKRRYHDAGELVTALRELQAVTSEKDPAAASAACSGCAARGHKGLKALGVFAAGAISGSFLALRSSAPGAEIVTSVMPALRLDQQCVQREANLSRDEPPAGTRSHAAVASDVLVPSADAPPAILSKAAPRPERRLRVAPPSATSTLSAAPAGNEKTATSLVDVGAEPRASGTSGAGTGTGTAEAFPFVTTSPYGSP